MISHLLANWEAVVAYFVTGATGFVGRFLLGELLARGGTVHVLCRPASRAKLDAVVRRLGVVPERVVAVLGDLAEPGLGISAEDLDRLAGRVTHMFHVAARYDLGAQAAALHADNVDGTRHAMAAAAALRCEHFHYVSSIVVAGLYPGVFSEDMFAQATELDHNPYFRSKHDAEAAVRAECPVPWRIYRPGIVVGHSQSGEIDKIDGPYYFFRALQKLRSAAPSWLRWPGVNGGEINIVPVDFVARALDHIAHQPGLDAQTFHLTDPHPLGVGALLQAISRAARAPRPLPALDLRAMDALPARLADTLTSLPGVRQAVDVALGELGIPRRAFTYLSYPTRFDSSRAQAVLAGTGITVPPVSSYSQVMWDYWERTYSPNRRRDRQVARAVRDKTVLVTGSSSGIGRATAIRLGTAGARVVLVARGLDRLDQVRAEIEALGGTAFVHPCDLSDMSDIERMTKDVLTRHGRVDILINNAGRSIRRSVALSYDRLHDYERTMAVNYFGPVRLILSLLPTMRERGADGRRGGHIINVSSIGVQTNIPRFSAYVASKAALDAFSRSIASEVIDDGVHLSTIHMPLVRTPMIAPTTMYDRFPTMTPLQAADLICDAMLHKPKKVGTALGNAGELAYQVAPRAVDRVLNAGYRLFPDSVAAKGADAPDEQPSAESLAFAHVLRGVHW